MQNKYKKEGLKATIFYGIVAFLIVIVICMISIRFGKEKFLMATDLVDMITIDTQKLQEEPIPPVLENFEEETEDQNFSVLLNPPDYGAQYATLKIPSIGIDLPIFYGKTLDLLKKGMGHDNDSYFPGEGGSVVLMGHNYGKFLRKLPQAKIGDEIQISTNYGEFIYQIYDTQIVNEYDTDKVPITDQEEILMIYTCWPINNVGYATERYVVYSKVM